MHRAAVFNTKHNLFFFSLNKGAFWDLKDQPPNPFMPFSPWVRKEINVAYLFSFSFDKSIYILCKFWRILLSIVCSEGNLVRDKIFGIRLRPTINKLVIIRLKMFRLFTLFCLRLKKKMFINEGSFFKNVSRNVVASIMVLLRAKWWCSFLSVTKVIN